MRDLKENQDLQLNNTYTILERIGDGGFSATYKAIIKGSDKTVVIKHYKNDSFANVAETKMYWEREVSVDSDCIEEYPGNCVRTIESYIMRNSTDDAQFFLVQEFIDDAENFVSLKRWLNDNLRAPKEECLDLNAIIAEIFIPLCDFLDFVHKKGAIHRDITFNNILLHKNDHGITPYLIDWGAARRYDPSLLDGIPINLEDLADKGTVLITPGFFSPEVILKKNPVPQTDIYMIGANLFYVATNGYTRVKPTVPEDYVLYPQDYNMNVSDDLNKIVMKCTQYQPKDRFLTCGQLRDALQAYLNDDTEALSEILDSWILQLRIKNNEGTLTFNSQDLDVAQNQTVRIGREKIIKSTVWRDKYKGIFRVITRCKDRGGNDRAREQFVLSFNQVSKSFVIKEGRNTNPTELNGKIMPNGEWVAVETGDILQIGKDAGQVTCEFI